MKAAFIADLQIGPAGYYGGIRRKLTEFSEAYAGEFGASIAAGEYDFAIQLGDLIEDVDEETDRRNLQRGQEILQPAGVPLYHVLGNHDTAHLTATELFDLLGISSACYSFRSGGCQVIMLQSLLPYPHDARSVIPPEQLTWLQAELRPDSLPAIVFVHHSLADQDLSGNPWFDGRPEAALIENRREARQVLADSGKVVAVINGHLHWNRVDFHDGIPYITVQSAVENFRNDGIPAHAWGELSLTKSEFEISVFGNDPMSFRYKHRRGLQASG